MKKSRPQSSSRSEIPADSDVSRPKQSSANPLRRREFFRISSFSAAASLTLPALLKAPTAQARETAGGSSQRRNRAYQIRQQAAMSQMQQGAPGHPTNGDELAFPNKIS